MNKLYYYEVEMDDGSLYCGLHSSDTLLNAKKEVAELSKSQSDVYVRNATQDDITYVNYLKNEESE